MHHSFYLIDENRDQFGAYLSLILRISFVPYTSLTHALIYFLIYEDVIYKER